MKSSIAQLCVTGIGLITPFGVGPASLRKVYLNGAWKLRGACAAVPRTRFSGKPKITGSLSNRVGMEYLSTAALCACLAAEEALKESQLTLGALDRERVGVSIGSAFASANAVHEFSSKIVDEGPGAIEPLDFPNTVSNAAAGYLGASYGLMGLNISFSAGLKSSSLAISYACEAITSSMIDIAIAGGVEELVSDDSDVVGGIEGCALIVIERVKDATERGAIILGYLTNNPRQRGGLPLHAEESELSQPANSNGYCAVRATDGGEVLPDFTEFISMFHGASTAVAYALATTLKQHREIISASLYDMSSEISGGLRFCVSGRGNGG